MREEQIFSAREAFKRRHFRAKSRDLVTLKIEGLLWPSQAVQHKIKIPAYTLMPPGSVQSVNELAKSFSKDLPIAEVLNGKLRHINVKNIFGSMAKRNPPIFFYFFATF